MTEAQAQQIETSGIIPNELLVEYLAGKNLVKPPRAIAETAASDASFQTMYDNYKANRLKGQKAANEQLKGRR